MTLCDEPRYRHMSRFRQSVVYLFSMEKIISNSETVVSSGSSWINTMIATKEWSLLSCMLRCWTTWRKKIMNEAIEFLRQNGAMVLFAVVFVEKIGLPIPAIPVLVAAGVLAGSGYMNLWVALSVTVSAALVADWIWFELGRRRGRQVLDWLCRIALEPDSCVRKTETFFLRHGPHSLVLAKFIPGLSTIAPPLAGIVGLGAPLFLLYDGLGAVLWAGSSVWIGYIFSDQLEQAFVFSGRVAPIATIGVLGVLAGYVLYKARFRRRQLRSVPRIRIEELLEKLKTEQPPL